MSDERTQRDEMTERLVAFNKLMDEHYLHLERKQWPSEFGFFSDGWEAAMKARVAEVARLEEALQRLCEYTNDGKAPYDIRWAIASAALKGEVLPDFRPAALSLSEGPRHEDDGACPSGTGPSAQIPLANAPGLTAPVPGAAQSEGKS